VKPAGVGVSRDFAGYAFEYVGPIQVERDSNGAVREFTPQSRYQNHRALPLNDHGAGPFCRFTIASAVHRSGVYVITLVDQPVYAGKCRDLARRFGCSFTFPRPASWPTLGGQPNANWSRPGATAPGNGRYL